MNVMNDLLKFFLCSCSDDVPLMRDEFLNETPIGPHDLGAEPILGLAIDEFDSWSPSVPRDVLKSLKDKQVSIIRYSTGAYSIIIYHEFLIR